MNERRDDTPETDKPSRAEHKRPRGSYYYDDSTGYEIYDPEADADDEEDVEDESPAQLSPQKSPKRSAD